MDLNRWTERVKRQVLALNHFWTKGPRIAGASVMSELVLGDYSLDASPVVFVIRVIFLAGITLHLGDS